ncbi:MAG: OmpA family protein [Flavobacteriales bacterium]|nr:OmpA family protein [Flavobacteriales bacterium]
MSLVHSLRALLVASGALFHTMSSAQSIGLNGTSVGNDVIVEAAWEESGDTVPLFRAIWRGVDDGQAEFVLQRMRAEQVERKVLLDRLIEAGIGAYLDARVHFTRDGVKGDQGAEAMTRDLNGMIAAAVESLGADVAFTGLTPSTQEQLDRLLRIDWSQARFGVDGGAEQDKYLAIYFYVRTQREELERQLRADLLALSTVAVIGPSPASPGTTVRINSTCGTVFDEQNFLCALDLRLADASGGAGLEPVLSQASLQALSQPAPAPVPTGAKVRKRDRWLKEELDAINERIDRLDQRKELWELRDRMDDMEDRITGIELEVGELHVGTGSDNPSANLAALTGLNITVRFERNSTDLEPDQRVLLNEVFEQLARFPQERVLITGYTDRSGDPARNLWLSEQRAKAVRAYLLERGIASDRLLVNYYGDSRSVGRDPGERRVEVEWIR